MKTSLPLNTTNVKNSSLIINRSHALLHFLAITSLIHYRLHNTKTPIFIWLTVFASELLLSYLCLLRAAFGWRPTFRTVFPERLREEELPSIDVFICTTDPKKEPTLGVMNTVLSAMALDYPAEKLNVYISDDGGSLVTLEGTQAAWEFAISWVPFCRKYRVKARCPKVYFSADGDADIESIEFLQEKREIKEKYEVFKEHVKRVGQNTGIEDSGFKTSQDHPPLIEVINENGASTTGVDQQRLIPRLVYVSREKKPSVPHHFKAGALNALLRVSSMISNSPYILGLDCDMYCNDASSARQAMCFHLDPKYSPPLAFVQFPQKYRNISKNDIYHGEARSTFAGLWHGLDGLLGPILSGTGYYIKREALYGIPINPGIDFMGHKQSFGPSNEFITSLRGIYKPTMINGRDFSQAMLQETKLLASSTYEKHTDWGKKVGFLYISVVEDVITGFTLHCKGWTSVYCDPPRSAFLGSAPTHLSVIFIQGTRWSTGLLDVAISKYCPIIYGSLRMSILQSLCYASLAFYPVYSLPILCFATIPSLCLLNGIPLYPKVTSPSFLIFLFIFLSSLSKHLVDVLSIGGSFQMWTNEGRMWYIRCVTMHLYGALDAIMKRLGLREASFIPTSKVDDEEKANLYDKGVFDFRAPNVFLVPLVTIVIVNLVSVFVGVARATISCTWDKMFGQVFLSFFILLVNYPIVEGTIRKDKGRISPTATLVSMVCAMIFMLLGSIVLMHCP